jgi:hypothetical protein
MMWRDVDIGTHTQSSARLPATIAYLPSVGLETAYHQQHGVDSALSETAS